MKMGVSTVNIEPWQIIEKNLTFVFGIWGVPNWVESGHLICFDNKAKTFVISPKMSNNVQYWHFLVILLESFL